MVRRKFKHKLRDQTQKPVQDTTGHSALLIRHLAACSPGAWGRLHGGNNRNVFIRVYPCGFFILVLSQKCYVPYSLVTPELGWQSRSEGDGGPGKVQKWLPSIGLGLSASLFLPTPQGWEDGEEGEGLSVPSQATWGYSQQGSPFVDSSDGIPMSSLTLLLTPVVQGRLDLLQHGGELANSN